MKLHFADGLWRGRQLTSNDRPSGFIVCQSDFDELVYKRSFIEGDHTIYTQDKRVDYRFGCHVPDPPNYVSEAERDEWILRAAKKYLEDFRVRGKLPVIPPGWDWKLTQQPSEPSFGGDSVTRFCAAPTFLF